MHSFKTWSFLGLTPSDAFAQANKLAPLLARLYVPVLLLLVGFTVVGATHGIPMTDFMREPQMIVHSPWYVGMISTLGCFVWAAAAAICFFGWAMLRHYPDERRFSLLLLCSGILTIHLMLDDVFMFHESVYGYYFGITENMVYVTYALAAIAGVIAFRKTVLKTEYMLLLLALGFMAMKLVVEVTDEHAERIFGHWALYFDPENLFGPWRIMVEDGLKLFGIVSWLAYFSRATFNEIKHAAARQPVLVSATNERSAVDYDSPRRASAGAR